MKLVRIRKGKEKPIRQHHPWVFSGAIERVETGIVNGDIVELRDAVNLFLAYGYYNDRSKITIRLLEWNRNVEVNEEWWKIKLRESVERRAALLQDPDSDSCRLVHSEADLLPGLIADKFGEYIVVQFLTQGAEQVKELITEELFALLNPKGIYERSDAAMRDLEGLVPSNGLLKGELPEGMISIRENGLSFLVDIAEGQKSGYFLDQRENRKKLAGYCKDLTVLDCFCYSGGFSLYAAKAGAKQVISIDSSRPAIDTLNENYRLNKLAFLEEDLLTGDVFKFLREAQEKEQRFDLIILDPPKFAPTRSAVERAQRAYKDLNMQALKLLQKGGLLATFSCSGGMSIELFRQVVAWAALDAGKELQIIDQFGQPADHPVKTSFPESEYLKGLLCKVI